MIVSLYLTQKTVIIQDVSLSMESVLLHDFKYKTIRHWLYNTFKVNYFNEYVININLMMFNKRSNEK